VGDGDTAAVVRATTDPPRGRELRLDLTTRNHGFIDAADILVFISVYTAAFVYGRRMTRRIHSGIVRLLGFGRGPFEDPAIGVDEGQVLALGLRKAGPRRRWAFVK
jgi:hypothetical protein